MREWAGVSQDEVNIMRLGQQIMKKGGSLKGKSKMSDLLTTGIMMKCIFKEDVDKTGWIEKVSDDENLRTSDSDLDK